MKQYLLFGFDQYYPSGGWNDFLDSFDSVEEATMDCHKYGDHEYYQIVDSQTGDVVWSA